MLACHSEPQRLRADGTASSRGRTGHRGVDWLGFVTYGKPTAGQRIRRFPVRGGSRTADHDLLAPISTYTVVYVFHRIHGYKCPHGGAERGTQDHDAAPEQKALAYALRTVMQVHSAVGIAVHAVCPRRRHLSPRVDCVVDQLISYAEMWRLD
jgi:hypothetical protein